MELPEEALLLRTFIGESDWITLRLRPWQDVESQDDKLNRREIYDPDLALQEPTWGEPVP